MKTVPFRPAGILAACLLLAAARPAAGQQDGVDGFRYPLPLEPRTYKMVSIPFEFEREISLQEVFEDDYGPYAPDVWRLFYYDTLTERYEEYFEIKEDAVELGTAVWLITRDGAPFDVFEFGEQAAVPTETVFLEAYPGWNQFGNPFDFPIPCKALLDRAREVPEVQRVEGPVYFDGRQYRYNVEICNPWEGYFAYLETELPVLPVPIPPDRAGREAALEDPPVAIDADDEYLLQLSAALSGAGWYDTQNYVGLLEEAGEGLDEHDFREAPPIGENVRLSIVEGARRFAGNFKPTRGPGQRWDFVVQAPRSDEPVVVTLRESGRRPDGFELYVLDRDRGAVVPLRDNAFQVDLEDEDRARHFTLLLGTRAYADAERADIPLVPTSYALLQNYPNPFNPETVIRYQLERRSDVALDVYDVLGQRVRRLVQEAQGAGDHAARWDGRDDAGSPVASGLYLYRLRAGAFTDTKKMILMR